jgi:hypothetical protein
MKGLEIYGRRTKNGRVYDHVIGMVEPDATGGGGASWVESVGEDSEEAEGEEERRG